MLRFSFPSYASARDDISDGAPPDPGRIPPVPPIKVEVWDLLSIISTISFLR